MKLFQIEEPEGAPLAAEGPGVAVGIGLDATGAAVAIAVGGNPEILPGADGERYLVVEGLILGDAAMIEELFLDLRSRAEKQLHRPVTHAVIAATPLDATTRQAIEAAAPAAGLTILRLIEGNAAAARAPGLPAAEAAALGAAVEAEDAASSAA